MTNTEIIANLVLGIIGGLIAVPITLFFQLTWRRIIIPWFEERIYSDAHVEGKWQGTLDYGGNISDDDLIFDIERQSHSIFGSMMVKSDGKIYDIKGEFRNMIMTISYSPRNQQDVDRGCFTFLLIDNGQELNGFGAFYYNPDHKIATGSLILRRS